MQDLGSLSSPPQITAYMKAPEKKALDSMHGCMPGTALLTLCSSMQDLYCTASCEVNYIHISTVITALGRVRPAAQRHFAQQDQPQACHAADALYRLSLEQLQPMLQDMDAQGISNIMLSSAKLGLNPDDFVPGMVHPLADRFQQLMKAANTKQRPNAQSVANFVWALATMHHAAATDKLLDLVCGYFASLVQHSDAQQRPKAQEVSNIMWALAEVKHSPKDGWILDDFCMYMHGLLQHPDARQRPTSQAVSNVMWALAESKHSLRDDRLLDDFCMYMHGLFQSQDQRARPNAQNVANMLWAVAVTKHTLKDDRLLNDFCMYMHGLFLSQDQRARPNTHNIANMLWAVAVTKHTLKDGRLLDDFCMYVYSLLQSQDQRARPASQAVANMLWALAQLQHAPPSEVVSAMLDYLVALCQTPGLQPKSQEISNIYIACAELRLSMRPAQVEVLLKHLLGLPVSEVSYQAYSNVAWSLAVMGYLDIGMFNAFLNQLSAKRSQLLGEPGTTGSSAQLPVEAVRQLHQASEWLKPPQGSDRSVQLSLNAAKSGTSAPTQA